MEGIHFPLSDLRHRVQSDASETLLRLLHQDSTAMLTQHGTRRCLIIWMHFNHRYSNDVFLSMRSRAQAITSFWYILNCSIIGLLTIPNACKWNNFRYVVKNKELTEANLGSSGGTKFDWPSSRYCQIPFLFCFEFFCSVAGVGQSTGFRNIHIFLRKKLKKLIRMR